MSSVEPAAATAASPNQAPSESSTPARAQRLQGVTKYTVILLGTVYAGYYLLTSVFGLQSAHEHRGYYIGFATVLIFLVYPSSRKRSVTRASLISWALALLSAGAFGYFVINYEAMIGRAGVPSSMDVTAGLVAVALSLEVARRTTGWALPIITTIAIGYVFAGPYLPGLFEHSGTTVQRFVGSEYMSFNGLFGVVADTFATYVFLFIIFGAIFQKSGAGQFFIDLPIAIAGRFRGGPAKAALLMSAIMGSISGSAVANVMTTGVFTIPLMKRVGYSRNFAGGVETAASTGGQVLPPVMGAGAFLIAEFTGTPYSHIVLISIVPALMYFFAVYVMIDFESLKRNLRGISSEDRPDLGSTFKKGWFFTIPLVIIFALVIMDYSPAYAAFWGILSGAILGLIPYKGISLRGPGLGNSLWHASVTSLSIAGIAGVVGVIVGVMSLTGFGLRFSSIIIQASGGYLLAALILVAIASWILGMGMTATSSYVIVAVVAAPALIDLGLTPLVAHLIIFWVSQDANLTPPVCITAFAAAGISGGSPMGTAGHAWMIGRGLYIVPLLMAYSPLVTGPVSAALLPAASAFVGIYVLCSGMSRYLLKPSNWLETITLLIGGGLLIAPGLLTNLFGLALFLVVLAYQRYKSSGSGSAFATGPDVGDRALGL